MYSKAVGINSLNSGDITWSVVSDNGLLPVCNHAITWNSHDLLSAGPRFNIKMTSYQYRKSHCGDKTILRPSYLHNGISYTGKTTSLYWIRALDPKEETSERYESKLSFKKTHLKMLPAIYQPFCSCLDVFSFSVILCCLPHYNIFQLSYLLLHDSTSTHIYFHCQINKKKIVKIISMA